jgi:hypothetical protein
MATCGVAGLGSWPAGYAEGVEGGSGVCAGMAGGGKTSAAAGGGGAGRWECGDVSRCFADVRWSCGAN